MTTGVGGVSEFKFTEPHTVKPYVYTNDKKGRPQPPSRLWRVSWLNEHRTITKVRDSTHQHPPHSHMDTYVLDLGGSGSLGREKLSCSRVYRSMLAPLPLELGRSKRTGATVRAGGGVNGRAARGEWVPDREGRAASDKRVPHGLCGRTKVIVLLDHHAQPCGYRGWMRGNGACECLEKSVVSSQSFGQCR